MMASASAVGKASICTGCGVGLFGEEALQIRVHTSPRYDKGAGGYSLATPDSSLDT